MKNQIIHLAILGCVYAAFGWWTENGVWGIALKKFLTGWRTDSLLHLILCGGSVFILSACAILGLGLGLQALGL